MSKLFLDKKTINGTERYVLIDEEENVVYNHPRLQMVVGMGTRGGHTITNLTEFLDKEKES